MARSTRARANKRKPFSERSVNQPSVTNVSKKKQKKSKRKRKIQRRKSRQIGDDVVIFIQEKKSKSMKLHPAHVDLKTGGITFMPANRKTPIAYDHHRHLLIEKTPDGDEIEIEIDTEKGIEISKKEDVGPTTNTNQIPVIESRGSKRQRSAATKKTYAEYSDHDDESVDESEFEAPVKTYPRRAKSTKRNQRSTKNCSSGSESDNEEEIFSPAREIKKKSAAAALKLSNTFSSPAVKTDWEEQSDWRCAGAIDY